MLMDSDTKSPTTLERARLSSTAETAEASVSDDKRLLEALRDGDETAFATLVKRYHPSLHRLALTYVRDPAIAQEVVQDTWIGVLNGIDTFESRASLKTWIFRILINRAKTSATREGRQIPFSQVWDSSDDVDEPAVDPERFISAESATGRAGWWSSPPGAWNTSPEDLLLSAETRAYIERAIAALPGNQREVITLRDIEGISSEDVCNLLRLTETNQRVLLHRARSRVRQALEQYFGQE